MKKTVKFSKSYDDIINLKTDFYSNNKLNLSIALKLNKIYLKGPKRKICKNCGHLNGEKHETKNFFNKLYISGAGSKNIEKNYKKNFNRRVKNVYNDKVLFLKKIIKKLSSEVHLIPSK
tara:strand:- start:154 stop:510 length:357 start_codon:yes stop_codon:yes gene_type:complete